MTAVAPDSSNDLKDFNDFKDLKEALKGNNSGYAALE